MPAPHPAVETAPSDPAAAADAEARQLAAAVARGDEAAFGRLYEGFQARLLRFALMLARGDETAARDAVQAAFLTAARKLRGAESAEHLWNWLARVVRQHLAKARRQRQREGHIVSMAEPPECSAAAADSALERELDAALLTLAGEEREIVELFYFDHLSHKEIAARLDATPKAVSSRLERARAKLRAVIARNLSHET